ncbi:MAG TPA: AzlD domain-containing protein [Alphaproteobacteria bacterium]|nr:AzlD domain-containing protein [Alphaproteobacteria bacterium]
MAEHWPYAVMLAGAAITYFWRALGVALAGRLDPESRMFEWVGCVAYALLAGLIARMIVLPIGPLAETTMGARIASAAIAAGIFLALRRNVLLGVAAGATALVLLSGFGGQLP